MSKGLKMAVIGSGSTYTPELIDGLIARRTSLPVTDIVLMDVHKEKLHTVGQLAQRMLLASGYEGRIQLTQDLDEAVRDADYVMAQIRVGGVEARIKDEKIPLKYGLLGQETTGIGGFMKALRTIPALMHIAKRMEALAPNAWLINFSNPSGILADTLLNHTGVRTIGLCNGPVNMLRDVRNNMTGGRDFEYTYVGLNHLAWITSVRVDGRDLMREQGLKSGVMGGPKNIPDLPFDDRLLQAAGGYPSGYLSYYYHREQQLKKCLEAKTSRGEDCQGIEQVLLEKYRDKSLQEKPEELNKRGGALYSTAAISLVDAIENDKGEQQIVNVLSGGALPFMDCNDAVETACIVDRKGAHPMRVTGFDNQHIIGLMRAVKAYEKLTIQAGLTGDYNAALAALLTHPLVGDYAKAQPALDEMLEANRAYLPQFFPAERPGEE